MSIQALELLIEHAITDPENCDTEEFVRSLLHEIQRYAQSDAEKEFEIAFTAAKVLAFSLTKKLNQDGVNLLMDISFAATRYGRTVEALPLVEQAMSLAQQHNWIPELRRSYNVYSGLSTDIGFPARGLEYAVKAISTSIRIGYELGVASAYANATAALYMLGLYRECIEISRRIVDRFGADSACEEFVAIACMNIAISAIALQKYQLGTDACKQAVELLSTRRDSAGAFMRLVSEANWLKCAIGLNDMTTAAARLEKIESLACTVKTKRMVLNKQLADAAYEAFSGDARNAVTKLLRLLEVSESMPTLFRDNLELLIRTYEKLDERANVMLYLGRLIDFIAKMRADNIKRALNALQVKVQTLTPGRVDAREVLFALQREERSLREKFEVLLPNLVAAYETFAITAELKEDTSGLHIYRVGRLARLLAEAIDKDANYTQAIEHAARMHDIGKLGLPDEVIMNSGTLTPEQHQAMQMHCEIGAQMIDQAEHPALALAREVAQSHHERWDGTGYPQKLKGEAIPLAARIASIAEVYDVLTHERSYRPAHSHEEAVAMIEAGAGTQFDPSLVPKFTKLIRELWARHGDELPAFLAEAGNESSFLQAKDEMTRLVDAL